MKKTILLFVLILVGFFSAVCFSANEIKYADIAGQTNLYVRVIKSSDLTIWDGDSYEASPAWGDTDVTLTENEDISGLYVADMPTSPVGTYIIMAYSGSSPAVTDTRFAIWEIAWSGLNEVSIADVNSNIRTDIAGLNDFDPAYDTVAHVTLVDTTTTNTDMVSEPNNNDIEAIYDLIKTDGDGDLDAIKTYVTSNNTILNNRWTVERAGYLDNLNVSGPVATAADIAAHDANMVAATNPIAAYVANSNAILKGDQYLNLATGTYTVYDADSNDVLVEKVVTDSAGDPVTTTRQVPVKYRKDD